MLFLRSRLTQRVGHSGPARIPVWFQKGGSTIDKMFLAMQPQEKCRKHQHELHMAFIDLTKAFQTVKRALMEAADQVRLSSLKFLAFLRQLHDGMTVRVATSVLAPILFNVFLVAVALLARQRLLPDAGVEISYRLAGILFDLSRLTVLKKDVSPGNAQHLLPCV